MRVLAPAGRAAARRAGRGAKGRKALPHCEMSFGSVAEKRKGCGGNYHQTLMVATTAYSDEYNEIKGCGAPRCGDRGRTSTAQRGVVPLFCIGC